MLLDTLDSDWYATDRLGLTRTGAPAPLRGSYMGMANQIVSVGLSAAEVGTADHVGATATAYDWLGTMLRGESDWDHTGLEFTDAFEAIDVSSPQE